MHFGKFYEELVEETQSANNIIIPITVFELPLLRCWRNEAWPTKMSCSSQDIKTLDQLRDTREKGATKTSVSLVLSSPQQKTQISSSIQVLVVKNNQNNKFHKLDKVTTRRPNYSRRGDFLRLIFKGISLCVVPVNSWPSVMFHGTHVCNIHRV